MEPENGTSAELSEELSLEFVGPKMMLQEVDKNAIRVIDSNIGHFFIRGLRSSYVYAYMIRRYEEYFTQKAIIWHFLHVFKLF